MSEPQHYEIRVILLGNVSGNGGLCVCVCVKNQDLCVLMGQFHASGQPRCPLNFHLLPHRCLKMFL